MGILEDLGHEDSASGPEGDKEAEKAPDQEQEQEPAHEAGEDGGEPEGEEPEGEEPEESPGAQEEKRSVPEAVFLNEKNQRRHLQQVVEGQSETLKQLNARIEDLTKKMVPEDEEIDKEDDPLAYLDRKAEKTQKTIEALRADLKNSEEEGRVKDMRSQVERMESDFASKNADYFDALGYLRDQRADELATIGLNEEQIASAIMDDYVQVVRTAMARGANPAEVVYTLSKKRGFAGKPEAKEETKPDKSLKSLAKKQGASGSLSSETAKSKGDGITAEDAAAMDPDEFDKHFSGPEGQRRWAALWN